MLLKAVPMVHMLEFLLAVLSSPCLVTDGTPSNSVNTQWMQLHLSRTQCYHRKFQTRPRLLRCHSCGLWYNFGSTQHSCSRSEGIAAVSAEMVNNSSYGGGNINLARNSLAAGLVTCESCLTSDGSFC